MIAVFAQIFVPVCEWCSELESGGWEWWIRGCWKWDCPPVDLLLFVAGAAGAAGAGYALYRFLRGK